MQSLALLKLLLFDWSFSALKCTCIWGRGGRGENAGLGSKRSPRRAFLLLEAVHALQNWGKQGGMAEQSQKECGVTQLSDLQSRGYSHMGLQPRVAWS